MSVRSGRPCETALNESVIAAIVTVLTSTAALELVKRWFGRAQWREDELEQIRHEMRKDIRELRAKNERQDKALYVCEQARDRAFDEISTLRARVTHLEAASLGSEQG